VAPPRFSRRYYRHNRADIRIDVVRMVTRGSSRLAQGHSRSHRAALLADFALLMATRVRGTPANGLRPYHDSRRPAPGVGRARSVQEQS